MNHRYDFALDLGDRFLRVQCKTGRLRNGAVVFSVVSTRVNTKRTFRRCYAGEVDLFAVYCPGTGRVYAVPAEEATSTAGTLRIDAPANGQVKRIRWAADYQLPG